MFLNCSNLIYLCFLVFELLWFVIFLADGRGSLLWTSSSIASPSMIVESSMNLHSCCIMAGALPSVCGQLIYLFLVRCLMGSGPAALNACHINVISLLCWCYVKVVFAGMPPYFLFGVNFFPSEYGVNLLLHGDLLITCDSQCFWDEPLYLVLDALHLLLGGGTMIKFEVFPKDAPSCYQELSTVICLHIWD